MVSIKFWREKFSRPATGDRVRVYCACPCVWPRLRFVHTMRMTRDQSTSFPGSLSFASLDVDRKTLGAYHSEIFETGQMVRKFPGKSGNCWISEERTIQPKIPEIPGWKSNGTEISREKCSKIRVYLTRLSSFSKCMQIRNFLHSAG